MILADIVGIGRTKAGEHWTLGLLDLAVEAGAAAITDAGCKPTCLIVANALGSALGDQRSLATYVAARLGLDAIEIATVEVDEASGGAAVRMALALVGAKFHENVLVIGAEKTTDVLPDALELARAGGLDVIREAGFGFSATTAAALTMQRYLTTYHLDHGDFYYLSALAHANAAKNKFAYFSWPLSRDQYEDSQILAAPLSVCDTAPPCDGAAALMIRGVGSKASGAVGITGSSSISYRPGIAGPAVTLELPAAQASTAAALRQAGRKLSDISLFELHDASSILAALSLEAVGLAKAGQALEMAKQGAFALEGPTPAWTFGGNKARGHTLGGTGIYQMVEAALQLTERAQGNQVPRAKAALVQCLGSFGATAVTHVLERR